MKDCEGLLSHDNLIASWLIEDLMDHRHMLLVETHSKEKEQKIVVVVKTSIVDIVEYNDEHYGLVVYTIDNSLCKWI